MFRRTSARRGSPTKTGLASESRRKYGSSWSSAPSLWLILAWQRRRLNIWLIALAKNNCRPPRVLKRELRKTTNSPSSKQAFVRRKLGVYLAAPSCQQFTACLRLTRQRPFQTPHRLSRKRGCLLHCCFGQVIHF